MFGKNLQELRKSKGLTQRKLAALLNMSVTGYASWEQGLSEPSISDVKKLAIILCVSTDELLGFQLYDYNFEYKHNDTTLIHKEKKQKV